MGFVRARWLVPLLLLVQGFLGGVCESGRLVLLRLVAAPLPRVGFAGDSRAVLPTQEEVAMRDQVRDARQMAFSVAKPALFPILDLDAARATLILGGGLTAAIQPGARVFSPLGCVGVVDFVLPHLSRVRLLHGKGMELPVMVRAGDVAFKGGIPAIFGILKGVGDGAVLAESHLPEGLTVGESVWLARRAGVGEDRVGVIESVGAAPRVRLTAPADRESQLAVENAQVHEAALGLFDEVPFAVVLLERGTGAGTIIDGPENHRLLPGMAVHFGSRYLGRVQSVSPVGARVLSPFDPGVETAVEWCFSDREVIQGSLIGRGGAATCARGAARLHERGIIPARVRTWSTFKTHAEAPPASVLSAIASSRACGAAFGSRVHFCAISPDAACRLLLAVPQPSASGEQLAPSPTI